MMGQTWNTWFFRVILGVLLSIGLILVSTPALAQEGVSALRGTVTDPSGAVVVGAPIRLTEPATGLLVRSVVSDKQGDFEIPDLKPGTYRLEATMKGFSRFVADDIKLDAGHVRRVDVPFAMAKQTEEVVEVKAGAQLIDTEGGTLNAEFTSKEFLNAPLVQSYPNPFAMFQALPGVQGYGWSVAINGMYFDQVGQQFDGVSSDRYGEQKNNINFFEEATVTTMNAPASSARPVSYNLTSKRGQNTFHGSVHYQRFDSAFNAFRPPQSAPPLPPLKKEHYIQHDGQAELGGPIWKDKTFFYASYFFQRVPAHENEFATVPTQAMMNGDFSAFLPQNCQCPGIIVTDPFTGNPFPNNVIPQNRLSPVALGLQQFYPKLAPGVGFQNADFTWQHPYTDGSVLADYYKGGWPFVRLDHNLTSKNSLFVTAFQRNTPYDWPGGVPALPTTHIRNEWQTSLTDVHTLTPTLTNRFVVSLSRDRQVWGVPNNGNQPHGQTLIQQIGLQGVNPGGYNGVGMPGISFGGSGFQGAYPAGLSDFGGVSDNATDWSLIDDVTWAKGRHVWTFGESLLHVYNGKDGFSGGYPDYGNFSFDGRYSGFSYSDFLLGLPNSTERSTPLLSRALTSKVFGAYAADTYKATSRLTLDYGLRWDYEGLATYADGLIYNFDPIQNQVIVPANHLNQVSPQFQGLIGNTTVVAGQARPTPDWGNWGPRIGVAYRLPRNMVIRGGYGLYWQRYSRYYNASQQGNYDGPFQLLSQNFTDPNSFTAPGCPPFQFPNPFPGGTSQCPAGANPPGGQGLTDWGRHWHNGSIHNFNVTLEKEVAKMGLRASYIGSRSENQLWAGDFNKKPANATPFTSNSQLPFPVLNYAWEYVNGGKAHYDALQLEAKRKQGFVTFDASYTLASDINNYDNVDWNDINHVFSRWAPNGGDTRNRVVLSSVWNLPFGRGKHYLSNASPVLNHIVGGWTLESFTYLASGWLFSPYFCADTASTGWVDYSNSGQWCGLPDVIPGAKAYLPDGKRTKDRWFNTAVYGCPDPSGVCGFGTVSPTTGQNVPFAYSQLGAFMIPGCTPTDPLCLNTQEAVVGRYGNAGVNSLHGDPLAVTHLSFVKTFPLTERVHMTYTAMISNLFNHPHYYNPDGSITDGAPNGGGCVGHLGTPGCGASESGFEYNHAGFRSIAMKLRVDF